MFNKNNLITQSNKLISSRYSLTLSEQRVVFAMISLIEPEDEDFKDYKVRISDFVNVLGLQTSKNIYNDIKNLTKNIITKAIQIEEVDGLLQLNWISSAKYFDKEGVIHLSFDPKLKPYLLKLKDNFTSTKFGIVTKFKSSYAAQIYFMLKQNESFGKFSLSVHKLKEKFPKYQEYKHLKARVLKIAHKQICEDSDLLFNIKELKVGKRVMAVTFENIRKNKEFTDNLIKSDQSISQNDIAENIRHRYGVTKNAAGRLQKILQEGQGDNYNKIFTNIDNLIQKNKVKNKAGFVVDCIEKGYYNPAEEKQLNLLSKVDKNKENNQNKVLSEKEIEKISKSKSWISIINKVEDSVNDEEFFRKWFKDLQLYSYNDKKIIIIAKSKFLQRWIADNYLKKGDWSLCGKSIIQIIQDLHPEVEDVKIISITREKEFSKINWQ